MSELKVLLLYQYFIDECGIPQPLIFSRFLRRKGLVWKKELLACIQKGRCQIFSYDLFKEVVYPRSSGQFRNNIYMESISHAFAAAIAKGYIEAYEIPCL